ncbi:MAG: hypothetical protein GY719_25935 [bacterium]|nr:hypothetical protein [bacterium]
MTTIAGLTSFSGTAAERAAAAVPLTGDKKIAQEDFVHDYRTRLALSGTDSIGTGAWTGVTWTSAPVDPLGAWSGSNPKRFTVPAGIILARFVADTLWATNTTGQRSTQIGKDGGFSHPEFEGAPFNDFDASSGGSSTNGAPVASPWITVAFGEYYELGVYQTSGGNLNLQAQGTWLEVEWRA